MPKTSPELKNAGTRLRKWRKSSNLTLCVLSRLIKVSQGSLSDLENNKSLPSADTIYKLWTLTDINIGWLLSGSEKKLRSIDAGVAEHPPEPVREIILDRTETQILITRK